MHSRKALTLFFALAGAMSAAAQTAEEIAEKALAARGGVARIKAIQAQRITGRISFGPDAEGPFAAEFKRPGKMRTELEIQGKSVVRTFDGQGSGWVINPFAGKDTAAPLPAEQMQNAAHEADFDGPLVDAKTKGNQIEFAGKETVEGRETYKLKVTSKDGLGDTYFYDAKTFLLAKWVGTRHGEGGIVAFQSLFYDYRDVGGLQFAFRIDSEILGAGQQQKIVVSKIELDPALEDARFGKP